MFTVKKLGEYNSPDPAYPFILSFISNKFNVFCSNYTRNFGKEVLKNPANLSV